MLHLVYTRGSDPHCKFIRNRCASNVPPSWSVHCAKSRLIVGVIIQPIPSGERSALQVTAFNTSAIWPLLSDRVEPQRLRSARWTGSANDLSERTFLTFPSSSDFPFCHQSDKRADCDLSHPVRIIIPGRPSDSAHPLFHTSIGSSRDFTIHLGCQV